MSREIIGVILLLACLELSGLAVVGVVIRYVLHFDTSRILLVVLWVALFARRLHRYMFE